MTTTASDDLAERLPCKTCGAPTEGGLYRNRALIEATDALEAKDAEIERLKAFRQSAVVAGKKLADQRDRAVEALQPFAAIAGLIPEVQQGPRSDVTLSINNGPLIAAIRVSVWIEAHATLAALIAQETEDA